MLYVSFPTTESRDNFYEAITDQTDFKIEDTLFESMILKWQHSQISNYEYLLYLNRYVCTVLCKFGSWTSRKWQRCQYPNINVHNDPNLQKKNNLIAHVK